MAFRDLRAFCALLEARGQLHRVPTPVSPKGEAAEIARRVAARGGGALLFTSVEGSAASLMFDAFGSADRASWALGADRLEGLEERFGAVVDMARGALGGGVGGRLRALGGLAQVGQTAPRVVDKAAVQAVVEREPSLGGLPLPNGSAADRNVLDHALVLWRDPASGARRMRATRLQVVGDRALEGLPAATAGPCAVVLGGDPATIYAAGAPLPADMDPLHFAGWLRRAPVELARARTSDLELPAHAEYALEGQASNGRFELGTVTRRRDPILLASSVGQPTPDARWMSRATEQLFLPLVRLAHPEVVALRAPAEGGFGGVVLAAIRRDYPGQAQKVIAGLFGMMPTMLARAIVVVDADVPLDDPAACLGRVLREADWRRDVILLDGPLEGFDPGSPVGPKMGLDATRKSAPPPASSSAESDARALVDRKWPSYGIPL